MDEAIIHGRICAASRRPGRGRTRVLGMLPLKYAAQTSLPGPMTKPEDVRIFRQTPAVISVLDYAKGIGHTDLVTVRPRT